MDVWLGLVFAWCAGNRVKVDGPWSQPAVAYVLLFLLVIRLPVTFYMYLAHPDWSWFYLVDSDRVPWLAVIPVLAADLGLMVGGYYLGARLLRLAKEKALYYAIAGLGALVLLVGLILWKRVLLYGSYEQFHSGHALGLMEVKLGYVLVVLSVGFVTAAAFVGWELWKDGRRAITR